MKNLQILTIMALCFFTIPAMASMDSSKSDEVKNKELRKEKKRFTKKVRSMKEAKNHPNGQDLACGKLGH